MTTAAPRKPRPLLQVFLLTLAALVGIPTLLWGFPGVHALLAIVPALIIAGTALHLRRPEVEGRQVRPGMLVGGLVFGLLFGSASVLMMWAKRAPEAVSVEVSAVIPYPADRVWGVVEDFTGRASWSSWMKDVEHAERGGPLAVGSRFRSKLEIERMPRDAFHEVVALEAPRHLASTVEPFGGSRLEDMVERVTLEASGAGTEVRYRLDYRVTSVMGRALEFMVVRRSMEKMLEHSLERLEGVLRTHAAHDAAMGH